MPKAQWSQPSGPGAGAPGPPPAMARVSADLPQAEHRKHGCSTVGPAPLAQEC